MERVKKLLNISYAYQRGYFGKGIGVAILDSGICRHQDFENRIIGFQDYTGQKRQMYDDNGHGTHVTGIIAGNGKESGGKYSGIAPQCHIIAIKVLDAKGKGKTDALVNGIYWAVKQKERYRIRVMNISVGMLFHVGSQEQKQLLQAVEYAWEHGIVVIAAAGNNGPKRGSITIPGISRKIITVGCFDDDRDMINKSGSKSGLKPDYSGRGPTVSCIVKPELVVPGTNIISCSHKGKGYIRKSGTSMATPVISGVVALLLEKYPEFTPKDVKLRFYDRAVSLGLPVEKQGWGMVDMRRLL